jgi:CubicO group peptidase (beta-lactamase class C family)
MWTVARLKNGQPNPDHYGFGWSIDNKGGHKVIGHGGSWQGFKSHISRYVDDKLTVVVLINQADAEPGPITDRVAEMYLLGTVK